MLTFALSKRKHPHRKGDEKTISARWPTLFLGFIHFKITTMNRLKTARQGIQRERKNYGLQLRNPLNIRQMPPRRLRSRGRCQRQQAGFCCFPHFDAGICAAIRLVAHYILHGGCDTVGKLLEHWAPSCPCRRDLYVACVCGRCGLSPMMPLRPYGPAFANLLSAMARQETGIRLSPLYVEELISRTQA